MMFNSHGHVIFSSSFNDTLLDVQRNDGIAEPLFENRIIKYN